MANNLTDLPQIQALLSKPSIVKVIDFYSHAETVDALRKIVSTLRAALLADDLSDQPDFDSPAFAASVAEEIEAARAPKVLTLDEEKAIYAETLSKREGIVALESEIKTHLAEGRNTDVLLKQLVHRQVSHKRGMDFTAKFHRITPEKLQEIIARGDAEAWAATE